MIKISPYKSFFKAAACISFDYESDAISYYSKNDKRKIALLLFIEKFYKSGKQISTGFVHRNGANNIIKALQERKLHASWFSIGHVLLKGNKNRDAYRINQKLASAPINEEWRETNRTFYHEPYNTYKKKPYYYLGDLTEELYNLGEDIQCHTFSHPVVSLEPDENIRMDIEDWQNTAVSLGYPKANILAFPYLADCYYHYPKSGRSFAKKANDEEEFEMRTISSSKIDILHQNGIELFTRCYSKEEETPSKGFKVYNESSVFYMVHKSMAPLRYKRSDFKEYIDNLIKMEGMIDFWCHPSNVFNDQEVEKFVDFLDLLKSNDQDLWVPTIRELWDHHKSIQQIDVHVSDQKVKFVNSGSETVKEIGIEVDLNQFSFSNHEKTLYKEGCYSKMVIDELKPNEILELNILS